MFGRHLRPDLQVVAAIEYAFGWRAQSEVLPLDLRQLDLEAGTLRLDAGQTKNDDGRLVYLTPELKALLGAQVARVHALSKKLGRIIPVLFPRLTGAQAGARIVDFRRRGGPRAGRPVCQDACATTSAGQRSAIWSMPGSPSAWP